MVVVKERVNRVVGMEAPVATVAKKAKAVMAVEMVVDMGPAVLVDVAVLRVAQAGREGLEVLAIRRREAATRTHRRWTARRTHCQEGRQQPDGMALR